MIKIHATKKLLAKLPIDEQGFLPVDKNAPPSSGKEFDSKQSELSGWHANLIMLQRRNCILFVHDTTRFPVFIPCLTKLDFASLDWHFQDAFMNTLIKIGADQAMMESAEPLLQALCFDSECNRSVQGTMNQMKGDIEHVLWFENVKIEDLSPYRVAAWLADRPCNVKGRKDCVWPIQEMVELLGDSIEPMRAVKHQQTSENGAGAEIIELDQFRKG